ncbi:uncharacterized protein EV154DRAFT_511915 [Mucor mucedo]|uniref:uncharacterized protein n=1 Tax=Mucor mucedo TaxID=29922 RepID=UPI0022205E4F|nr:uncharacterized protein EV154DRAFT_511915 [Mucor mucedo]KAI7890222.1 hypothetical protein EV154DRAFT_511915 [Mucor mucedo]
MSEEADNSYMAMLNNPVINPGPAEIKPLEKPKVNSRLKPSSGPMVQEAKTRLTSISKDVYLSSESDEPFEWINTTTEKKELPKTVDELIGLGLVDEEEEGSQVRFKTLEEFLKGEEYKEILSAFKELGGGQVYLVGEESITVLILSLVQENAIVGLKSLLVQT